MLQSTDPGRLSNKEGFLRESERKNRIDVSGGLLGQVGLGIGGIRCGGENIGRNDCIKGI